VQKTLQQIGHLDNLQLGGRFPNEEEWVMERLNIGYISYIGTFTQDPSFRLKTALLWYDQIIVQTLGEDLDSVLYSIDPQNRPSKSTLDELEEIIRVIAFDPIRSIPSVIRELNAETRLAKAASEAARDCILKEYPLEDPRDQQVIREIGLSSIALALGVQTHWALSVGTKEVSMLPTPEEADLLKRLGAVVDPTPSMGYQFFASKAPNPESLKWEDLLEARNHRYLKSFRSRVREIHIAAGNESNTGFLRELGKQYHADLEDITRVLFPSCPRDILVSTLIGVAPPPFSTFLQ